VTVKRWLKKETSAGTQYQLLPENPDFEPIIVNQTTNDFSIEGLAVGLIRPHGL
jgi:repressor LexA